MKLLKIVCAMVMAVATGSMSVVGYAADVQKVDQKMPSHSQGSEAQNIAMVDAKNAVINQPVSDPTHINTYRLPNGDVKLSGNNRVVATDHIVINGNLSLEDSAVLDMNGFDLTVEGIAFATGTRTTSAIINAHHVQVNGRPNENVIDWNNLNNPIMPIIDPNQPAGEINGEIVLVPGNWIVGTVGTLIPKIEAFKSKIESGNLNLANPADALLAKEAFEEALNYQNRGGVLTQSLVDMLDRELGNNLIDPATGKHVINEADRSTMNKRLIKAAQPVVLDQYTYTRFLSADKKKIVIPEYVTVKVVRPFAFPGELVLSAHSKLMMQPGGRLDLGKLTVDPSAMIENNDPRYDIPAIGIRIPMANAILKPAAAQTPKPAATPTPVISSSPKPSKK